MPLPMPANYTCDIYRSTNAPPAAIMVFRLSGLDQMLTVRLGPDHSKRMA